MAVIDAKKVRTAALLMHFDAFWVSEILDGEKAVLLNDDEKALFKRLDRRGFRADEDRKARAAAAVVEEGPVAVAVAGLPRLFAFFTSVAFLDCVSDGGSLVLMALQFIDTGPAARIEGCVAGARRRQKDRGAFSLAAGVGATHALRTGSVEAWSALRAQLGSDPKTAVMQGARLTWDLEGSGLEGIVVEQGLTNPLVGACSDALGTLLAAGRHEGGRARMRTMARAAGCDDDAEADDLLADLVRDGLLVAPDV